MIGYLTGKIVWRARDKIIIDTGATGYLVYVTEDSNYSGTGEQVELFIYTYVRDDTLDLYGFSSMKERELFDILLSVSRVGPSAGIKILSTLAYEEFINAIMNENIAILKQVKGIGPKTARRLTLELQDKIEELGREYETQLAVDGKPRQDLYDALNSLGYSQREIESAVASIDFAEGSSLEEKIKQTLSYLGKESY